ncbi:hypothetical protein RB653_006249 [Dictyostelium firmibasis]|uniref:FNIP repeat-containing protein n=1 Tax=Dictyostelium firmibasis TaxID=79012 RepID=A0AAN7U2L4_9MYCE
MTLLNYIEISRETVYQQILNLLYSLIQNNNNNIEIFKKLFALIKETEHFIPRDEKLKIIFVESPSENHKIFDLIRDNIKNVEVIKNLITDKDESSIILKKLLDRYQELHLSFIKRALLDRRIISGKCPLITGEDLVIREILSLELAQIVASVDKNHMVLKKTNCKGTCIGVNFNNLVYFKIEKDVGSELLSPGKEYAVYQLSNNLFFESLSLNSTTPSTSTSLLPITSFAPTELMVISKLPLLPEDIGDSNERKELSKIMNDYKVSSLTDLYIIDPDKEDFVKKSLKNTTIFIQASRFVDGISLNDLLKNNLQEAIESLEEESFGSYILLRLLIIPNDDHSDNLFIKDNKIIGIDSGECLETNDFEKTINGELNILFKSILFTFKSRMERVVNQNVANKLLSRQPNTFILQWLLQNNEKNKTYKQLIDMSLNDQESRDKCYASLKVPLQFKAGWIISMLKRFHLITKLLNNNKNCIESDMKTYQNLFEEVFPISYNYYQALSKKIPHDPIKQASLIFHREFSIEQIFKEYYPSKEFKELNVNNNNNNSKLSIIETIKELINYSKLEDFKTPIELVKWFEMVFEILEKEKIEVKLDESFLNSKKLTLVKLFKGNASFELVDKFIRRANFDSQNLNSYQIGDNEPILHRVIENINSENLNITLDRIRFIVNILGVSIDLKYNQETALDISARNNQFQVFKLLINLGAGKVYNSESIISFYLSLSHDQKIEFKPFLQVLYDINQKIAFDISLNALLPPLHEQQFINDNEINPKNIVSIVLGSKRILSDAHYNSLYNIDGTPIKSNENGTRSVPFIQDEYGNCIYFKFEPQFPGIAIAVQSLPQFLGLGQCSPCHLLASVGDNCQPVLLVQQVLGTILIEVLDNQPQLISQIDPSNISNLLITSMLINNGDGNLGNSSLVISNSSDSKKKIKLQTFDLDQSFMPSITKSIKSIRSQFNKSLQAEDVLLLFDQMKDPIHKDVIECFKGLDIYQKCREWLDYINEFHKASILHFQSNRKQLKKTKKTIVGIAFGGDMMKRLYSKLVRLQYYLQFIGDIERDDSSNHIINTHFELLEKLEPAIAIKVKGIIFNDSYKSISERFERLRFINKNEHNTITSSSDNKDPLARSMNPSSHLLESLGIPNAQSIHQEIWKGKYGPKKAMEELERMNIKYSNIQSLFQGIDNGNISKACDFHLENYLRLVNFSQLSEKQQKLLFNSISHRKEMRSLYIRNSSLFEIKSIGQSFNFDNIIEIEIYGCSKLNYFCGFSIGKKVTSLSIPSLKSLTFINCQNLEAIGIDSPLLRSFTESECSKLKQVRTKAPNIETIELKKSTTNYNILSKFSNLFKKNIQLTVDTKNEEVYFTFRFIDQHIEFMNLESKILSHFSSNKNKSLEIRTISSIVQKLIIKNQSIPPGTLSNELESLELHNIKSPFSRYSIPSSIKNLSIFNLDSSIESIVPGMIPNGVTSLRYDSRQSLDISSIPQSVRYLYIHDLNVPLVPNIIPHGVEYLYLYNFKQIIEIFSIPTSVKYLSIHSCFNLKLNPGIIPSSVTNLELYDIENSLRIGSIPTSVYTLTIHHGFKQKLIPGIIPIGVVKLCLDEIEEPLELGSIPSSVRELVLYDGFDQPLNRITIPFGVETLRLHNIKKPLEIGSIPLSVKSLTLCGFSHPLTKDIIPSSIENLHLCDIEELFYIPNSVVSLTLAGRFKQKFVVGAIPSSVEILKVLDDFDQRLYSGIIPNGVKYLYVHNIVYPLESNSFPSSLSFLSIHNGYRFPLNQGIIPVYISYLHIYDIDIPLAIGSIPNSIDQVKLFNYRHSLARGIIPEGVDHIELNDVKGFIEIGSIPSTTFTLILHNEFPLPLVSGIIPYGVQYLYINNIKQSLQVGSIPSSVLHLSLQDGFDQLLKKGIITYGVEFLYLGKLKQRMEIGSIPESVKDLTLEGGFDQYLSPGTIPTSVEILYLHEIGFKTLKDGSIPPTLKEIKLNAGFNLILNHWIVPNTVESLSIIKIEVLGIETISSHTKICRE